MDGYTRDNIAYQLTLNLHNTSIMTMVGEREHCCWRHGEWRHGVTIRRLLVLFANVRWSAVEVRHLIR